MRVFGVEKVIKVGILNCKKKKKLLSVEVLKAELICAMNIRKDYCIVFFCFLLNEERLCLRVAYFYWSKSE